MEVDAIPDDFDLFKSTPSANLPCTYILSVVGFATLIVYGRFFLATTLVIAARVLAVPTVVLLGILPIGRVHLGADDLGYVLVLAAFVFMTRWLLTIPYRITVSEDREILLRNWFREQAIPEAKVTTICTGGWRDPRRFLIELRYEGGCLRILNQFLQFHDFLSAVRILNPAIRILGF